MAAVAAAVIAVAVAVATATVTMVAISTTETARGTFDFVTGGLFFRGSSVTIIVV